MNGNSKPEMFDRFVRVRVEDAVNEIIARMVTSDVAKAQVLSTLKNEIAINVAYRCSRTYDVLEADNIFHWKKARSV